MVVLDMETMAVGGREIGKERNYQLRWAFRMNKSPEEAWLKIVMSPPRYSALVLLCMLSVGPGRGG